jgi:hypothetical protein
MRIGDLVRYRKSEFVTTRVYETFVGLVIKVTDSDHPVSNTRCVRWYGGQTKTLWHRPEDLEVINESR